MQPCSVVGKSAICRSLSFAWCVVAISHDTCRCRCETGDAQQRRKQDKSLHTCIKCKRLAQQLMAGHKVICKTSLIAQSALKEGKCLLGNAVFCLQQCSMYRKHDTNLI